MNTNLIGEKTTVGKLIAFLNTQLEASVYNKNCKMVFLD